MIFAINGKEFRAGVVSLARNFELLEKYRVTTEDGKQHRELSGVYKHYTLQIGNLDADEYDRLIDQLTANEETQTVTIADGETGFVTYEAMFEGISDELVTERNGIRKWDHLSVVFTAQEPMSGR